MKKLAQGNLKYHSKTFNSLAPLTTSRDFLWGGLFLRVFVYMGTSPLETMYVIFYILCHARGGIFLGGGGRSIFWGGSNFFISVS